MRILNLYIYALKNYANFKGRACRIEAISFMLFYTFYKIMILLMLTAPTLLKRAGFSYGYGDSISNIIMGLFIIFIILFILHIIPALTVGARRLHDINLSGWLQLFLFIPYVNIIANFVFFVLFYFIKGSDSDNNFGPVSINY